MSTNIISFDKEKMVEIAKKYDLVFVVLFGSRARGQAKNIDSDVDIAILTDKKPDLRLFGELFSAFSDLTPGENIDIRFLNGADLLFRFQVVKDGILLYGNKEAYDEYRLYTIKIYVDDGKKYFPFMEQLLIKRQKDLEAAL